MKTLYIAKTKVWGAIWDDLTYFATIKERNAYVKAHDYTDIAGTVKLTDRQYADFLRRGTWLDDREYDY